MLQTAGNSKSPTHPYSSKDKPFKKKAGQVNEERSPVKLITVLRNSLNCPPNPGSGPLIDSLSTSLAVGSTSSCVLFLLPKIAIVSDNIKKVQRRKKENGKIMKKKAFYMS